MCNYKVKRVMNINIMIKKEVFMMEILAKITCKLKGHDFEETNQKPDGWGYIATWFECNRCGHETVVTEREEI